MRRMRHSYEVWHGLMEWAELIPPALRIFVPLMMLSTLAFQESPLYIPLLRIELSADQMRCFVVGTHIASAWYGLRPGVGRGWLYELACCFLATEVVLFVHFLQHRFEIAAVLLALLVVGLVVLMTYGRRRLEDLLQRGYVPQTLMDDIIASNREGRTSATILSTAVRRYLVIGTALLLAVPSIAVMSVYGLDGAVQRGMEHAVIESGDQNQVLANFRTVQLLREDQWQRLDAQGKIDVLQVIADIETNHMQISPVEVVNCHLEDRTFGEYDQAKRQARIDLEKHEGYDAFEYLNTILHECRHAYQHDCVESLDWNDPEVLTGIYYAQARQWRYEHANYVSAAEDRDGYYQQAIEKDARSYAEEGMYVYEQYVSLGSLPAR